MESTKHSDCSSCQWLVASLCVPERVSDSCRRASDSICTEFFAARHLSDVLIKAEDYRLVCVVLPFGLQEANNLLDHIDRNGSRFSACLVTEDLISSETVKRLGCEAFASSSSDADIEKALSSAFTLPGPLLRHKKLAVLVNQRLATLSEEEAEVLCSICQGRLNKQIARHLRVSVRTIEQRRRRVFKKMGVASVAPLAAQVALSRALYRRCDDHSGGRVGSPHLAHFLDKIIPSDSDESKE